eukprot:scaffold9951_cov146-Cylindrotheca_fusiformis.AAC.6
MFIKKDLRKIPKILDDAIECVDVADADAGDKEMKSGVPTKKRIKLQEPLQELKLGRRKQEFNGSLKILCQPTYIPKLQQLKSLNLYDCAISDCSSIGLLEACPMLEILNLGRNPISDLPQEISQLRSLKQIWLDDCSLQGDFPSALCDLPELAVLKLPNNRITKLPSSDIAKMINLRVLCMDRNLLEELPVELQQLKCLQELFVRHNQLTSLPMSLPTSLTVLHVSSNKLTNLGNVNHCFQLKTLYANGNQLEQLPMTLLDDCHQLERLVVSHNPPLTQVPASLFDDAAHTNCKIVWKPNPQLTPPQRTTQEDVEMTPATE